MDSLQTAIETISQTTQERETQAGLTTQTQLLTSYSGKGRRNKVYLANTMILVKKTLSLANQPPLAERDLAERAKDWQDALEENVPVERLPDAFTRALKNHNSTFPINAFGILAAWNELDAEEREEKSRAVPGSSEAGRVVLHGDKEASKRGKFCRKH